MRDLTTYYAKLDCIPLQQALESNLIKFGELNIPSMYSFFVSLAQVAFHNLYGKSLAVDNLWLLNEPLYKSFRDTMVGGIVTCT